MPTPSSNAQRRSSNAWHTGRGRGSHYHSNRNHSSSSGGAASSASTSMHTGRVNASAGGTSKAQSESMLEQVGSLMSMLVGQMVVVTLQTGKRYVGVLSKANLESKPWEVVLTVTQSLSVDGEVDSEVIGSMTVSWEDVKEMDACNAILSSAQELDAVNRSASRSAGFRTDTEISNASRSDRRALQRWDDTGEPPAEDGLESQASRSSAQGWDQFAANEARFGIKSNYEESMYTTKLDRSSKDFKQREREADKIAREIIEQGVDNVHIAEERNQIDAADFNEEDRYGAVVRNTPASTPQPSVSANEKSGEKSAHNTKDESRTNKVSHGATPSLDVSSASTQAASKAAPDSAPNPQGSKALTADFRQFVSAERERLVVRKAELAQKEKQNRLTDLKAWAQSFRLKTPLPEDMSENKRATKKDDNKPAKDQPSSSFKMNASARSFNPAAASFTPSQRDVAPAQAAPAPAGISTNSVKNNTSSAPVKLPLNPVNLQQSSQTTQKTAVQGPVMTPSMSAASDSTSSPFPQQARSSAATPSIPENHLPSAPPRTSKSPASAAQELGPNSAADPSSASTSSEPNHPFFGSRKIKIGSLRNMEDFRPSKTKKMREASSITAWWPYNGRPYRQQVAMTAMPQYGKYGYDLGSVPMAMSPSVPPMMNMYPSESSPRVASQPGALPPMSMPQQPGNSNEQPGFAIMYPPYGQYRMPNQPYLAMDPMAHAGQVPMMYGAIQSPPVMAQLPYGPGQPTYPMPHAYNPRNAPSNLSHAGKRNGVSGDKPNHGQQQASHQRASQGSQNANPSSNSSSQSPHTTTSKAQTTHAG
ncbi:poly(A)-binding protein binding protein [Malassezia yamatoensis]|uniref:Poly(A)-binding protein binding protein n=1 Tax=Malassezia yamatoensis TaxID=253288 RepID=A0AAJ5YS17_9BASI|nr:poly(A)-binding protein binding protein [Malassezia yamatoensis]